MNANKTRIGIIGASEKRGWAAWGHIPALQVLPDYEISALFTSKKENTATLKAAFNVPVVYNEIQDLVHSKEVDMVLVAVKVPSHYELIKAAADAGKDVFSEWPLGRNLQEAETLTALIKEKRVKGFVGLQSRSVPAVRFIKDYIAQGHIGEVLSTTMVGAGILYGEVVDQANTYIVNPEAGAGLLPVIFSNAVDALCYVLGEFTSLSATTAIRRTKTRVIETGEEIPANTPDQVAVTGILESGAVAAVHFRGGTIPGTNFLWEINGTQGDIQITAPGASLAVFDLTVKASKGENGPLEELAIPTAYNLIPDASLGPIPTNSGQNYPLIRSGQAPTFEDALIRHRMIHAIETAAQTGERTSYDFSR
ncbi:Predicted dehydrogenase [Chitinophaga sp. YR627]|uniref:Gfo/Idh/MocA family protein n=1 Tax=Chitinophaga sp. YR627 TaxID=1881041 RepID=UPI0008ECBE19|nr:Gfo/Idh/MocA family oxidoreductase [Chitinophaga sp. YR627]SFO83677.1 Predicted dehydrogenase [Chitinophaga sp. YR627]